MKVICPVCEVWLVEPSVDGGVVSFWCNGCYSRRPCDTVSKPKLLIHDDDYPLVFVGFGEVWFSQTD